jgi:hypothetical protein
VGTFIEVGTFPTGTCIEVGILLEKEFLGSGNI